MSRPCAAIVGSGPSGFYAAEALLKAGLAVDIIERLPTPFGLVRSGVAPDHPKIKSVTALYERILSHPDLALFGNVTVGRDVTVAELLGLYDGVILACGAAENARLNIFGEDLPGSHAAGAFVGWYNGHPDYRDVHFPLDAESAVVVGHGNVALDVARILLSPIDRLRGTDIAGHALDALAESRIRHVHLVGRRGPVQTSFSPAELKETLQMLGCSVHFEAGSLYLDAACLEEAAEPGNDSARRNLALLQRIAEEPQPHAERRLHFHFLSSPVAVRGERAVASLRVRRNRLTGPAGQRRAEPTGETYDIACGLLLSSVGFRASALEDVPFDRPRGLVPNSGGRVTDGGQIIPGLYVTGWLKRGANGVIGTNRGCGQETSRALVEALAPTGAPKRGGEGLVQLLSVRDINFVGVTGWRNIDCIERRIGEAVGKPREKFTRIAELLDASISRSPAPTLHVSYQRP